MTPLQLRSYIVHRALELGFDQVGFAAAAALDQDNVSAWLSCGYHGEMAYMAHHRDLRLHPELLQPGAQTVVVLAANYYTPFSVSTDPEMGAVSRYAWGTDYHNTLRTRLKKLLAEIQILEERACGRVFVDSAPILEKEWARRCGIGWMGKHSCIISPRFGSWIFLAEIILNIALPADEPVKSRCGHCRLCLDACPTGALVAPYVVDSRRCLSYLTIELKADRAIPEEFRSAMANRIFGCDLCQSICPWNKKLSKPTEDASFYPRPGLFNQRLTDLAQWSEEYFSTQTLRSPIKRPGYAGFLRNVLAALQNR